jgi:hypothetical protein
VLSVAPPTPADQWGTCFPEQTEDSGEKGDNTDKCSGQAKEEVSLYGGSLSGCGFLKSGCGKPIVMPSEPHPWFMHMHRKIVNRFILVSGSEFFTHCLLVLSYPSKNS